MVTTTIPTLISIDLHMYKDALPESNTINSGGNSGAQIQGRTREHKRLILALHCKASDDQRWTQV